MDSNDLLNFDWTENKRHQNVIKHGLDFADVTRVWGDPFFQQRIDIRKKYKEIRYQAIAKDTLFQILLIAYTIRFTFYSTNTIYLISARFANKKETNQYYSQTFSYEKHNEN